MLPPERRLGRAMRLIEEKKYFTLHAGRQTGKTTSARWLAKHYNVIGRYSALWLDIESAKELPDPAKAFRSVLNNVELALDFQIPALKACLKKDEWLKDPSTAILSCLRALAQHAPCPLVVFFDEADGLMGQSMVSFLTQLRQGYIARSDIPFPHSAVLIGMRQVRDYPLSARSRREVSWLGTSSPFNIAAEAQTLAPFTPDDIAELLGQHTEKTGQPFDPAAVKLTCDLTQGHPWLVNAIADQIVDRDVEDRGTVVRVAHVEKAKETIILERRTHIDSLIARLHEPRVRRIIEPMLTGEQTSGEVLGDDFAYVEGLGLVTSRGRQYRIANPIYREVIARALTYDRQMQIAQEPAWFVRRDGRLDLSKLMRAFQEFWRKDGHLAAGGFGYREAGPHLMLMAFLQRIVNGGGRIEREYGLGRGALDLMVFWKDERHAIEVKLRRDTETLREALAQVARYLESAGLKDGWLVLFDLRENVSWKKKLYLRQAKVADKRIRLVGA